MACFSSRNAAFMNDIPSASNTTGRRPMSGAVLAKPFILLSRERRDSYGSLVLQAARLLGPPTTFEPSKLKVIFTEEEMKKSPLSTIPRAYTLTHCDFTANLTLAVSNTTYNDKLRVWQTTFQRDGVVAEWKNVKGLMVWQTTLQRDDVVAEWKKVKGVMSLHVHCYVSGPNFLQQLAAEFRYYIFSKELPLVLKAVVYGDSALFNEHPKLMEAVVWVYFHSKSERYNHVECWGPLKDATKRSYDDRPDAFHMSVVESMRNFRIPRAIFQGLVSFLL